MSEIDTRFWSAGGPAFFGVPLGPERATADGRGLVHHWATASIWWAPETGAHVVNGPIRDRYLALGAEQFLGHPLNDTHTTLRDGRAGSFERGSIYWPNGPTGAYEVYGLIGAAWSTQGAEAGPLGYPLSGELAHPSGGRHQYFERGGLSWSWQTGVVPLTEHPFAARLRAWSANRSPAPWTGLRRVAVAASLRELLRDPDLVDQGNVELCGPAAFLRSWVRRDPSAFLQFAMDLYDHGVAWIGDQEVAPDADAVRGTDYSTLASRYPGKRIPPAVQWMVLGALRDAENAWLDYEGTPDENVSAITLPGEVQGWLEAAKVFGPVRDETNLFFAKDLDHALTLDPTRHLAILLVNTKLFGKHVKFPLNHFPNHYVMLEAPVLAGDGVSRVSWWEYGRRYPTTELIPNHRFGDFYYGALIVG